MLGTIINPFPPKLFFLSKLFPKHNLRKVFVVFRLIGTVLIRNFSAIPSYLNLSNRNFVKLDLCVQLGGKRLSVF